MNLRNPSACWYAEAARIDPRRDTGARRDRVGLRSETGAAVIAVRVQVDETRRDEESVGVDDIAAAVCRQGVFNRGDLVAGDAHVGAPLHASGGIENRSVANQEVEALRLLSECAAPTGAEK